MKNEERRPEKKMRRTRRPGGEPETPVNKQAPAAAERTAPADEAGASGRNEGAGTEHQPVTNQAQQEKITNSDDSEYPVVD